MYSLPRKEPLYFIHLAPPKGKKKKKKNSQEEFFQHPQKFRPSYPLTFFPHSNQTFEPFCRGLDTDTAHLETHLEPTDSFSLSLPNTFSQLREAPILTPLFPTDFQRRERKKEREPVKGRRLTFR